MKFIIAIHLFFLLSINISTKANAAEEKLNCSAGILPHIEVNKYSISKEPKDFSVSKVTITDYFGETFEVKKYKLEIENFIIEGSLKLKSGHAPILTITDKKSGVITRVNEHELVRAKMKRPKTGGGYTNVTAACSVIWN